MRGGLDVWKLWCGRGLLRKEVCVAEVELWVLKAWNDRETRRVVVGWGKWTRVFVDFKRGLRTVQLFRCCRNMRDMRVSVQVVFW